MDAAEGKLLQVQHNIEKVLDSKKLEGQMFSLIQATKTKVAEECAVYVWVSCVYVCICVSIYLHA